jgi:flagellar motor switch protein FliM
MNRRTQDPRHSGEPETAPLDRPSPEPRPFPWDRLDRISADDAEVVNRLLGMLTPAAGGRAPLEAIGRRLTELAGFEHTVTYRGAAIRRDERFNEQFGDAFVTRFHLPPDPEIGALAVDMSLVDRWLTVLGDGPTEVRRLGGVDRRSFGIVTYLLLQVVDALKARGLPPVVLPTEPPLEDVLRGRLGEADGLVEVAYAVDTDRGPSFVRLFFPNALVRRFELFADNAPSHGGPAEHLSDDLLAAISTDLACVLGGTTLERPEFDALDPGDVLLLRDHGWEEQEGRLYLGAGAPRRYVTGRYAIAGGHWEFTIDDAHPREETTMTEDADDAEARQGTELLESPTLRLEARLGQKTLTLRELSRLKRGEVLQLDQSVGEPIDLVVDDRVVGRGELVDVEGQIGVRIQRLDT